VAAEGSQGLTAKMDNLVREQAERRVLTEQRGESIKARAHEYMTKQVQAAERYVQHRRELGKRARKAAPPVESAFEPEPPPAPPAPPPAPPVAPPRRARRAPADDLDEDDAFLNNRWRD
jgi:hypothetical protein